ncbi:MAG: capsule assembly Wzi family protein [Bacteroidota bacterium]|nr:capsule assembly Wzi family protein [Bacteroidota bacterium]
MLFNRFHNINKIQKYSRIQSPIGGANYMNDGIEDSLHNINKIQKHSRIQSPLSDSPRQIEGLLSPKYIYLILFCTLFFVNVKGQNDTIKDGSAGNLFEHRPGAYPSQPTYTSSNNFGYHFIDRIEILSGSINQANFSAIKPYYRNQVIECFRKYKESDWLYKPQYQYLHNDNPEFYELKKNESKKIFYTIAPSQLYSIQKEDFTMMVNPVLAFTAAREMNNTTGKNNILYTNTRGVELRGTLGGKIGYYTFLTENQSMEPAYVKNYIDSHQFVMPGVGYLKKFKNYNNAYDYFIARGYITFSPVKTTTVMFGHDRNFIGNGIRSLILSDFSKDYLQLKINTKVWKFNYLNIFAELTDYRRTLGTVLLPKKYMAFHHLSMNVSKNLNIGLSETVVFSRIDSNSNGGFDFNYLNPVIFYRSIEQNNNSADNSMIAADWKWNFLKHFSFYGQVVFDEFLLKHLVKQDGYWANKYSIQSGLKYINVFDIKNLDYQFEYNMIRPYTYTHFKTSTAYTNYGQPMAHPMGANLKEQLHVLRYQPTKNIFIAARYMYNTYGADTGGTHWGANIFEDYHKRQLVGYPKYDLGNTIGQGIKTHIQYLDFTVTYMPWHNLFLELSYIYRNQTSTVSYVNQKSSMLYLNLRLNLPKRDMLF